MTFSKIIGAVRKADLDYHLIDDQDRIAVGVSGGKDSLVLLTALSFYERLALRYDHKQFHTVGIHLDMGFPDMDFSEVRKYMQEHNIEYHDEKTQLYQILQLHPSKSGKIECSLCSTLKKGAMVKAAQKYSCNKTAFAHHADDAVETLFLNMIYGGRIATFSPAMHLSNTGMDFIRPLVYCYEDTLANAAIQMHLPVVQSTCPNDGYTRRQDVKELLAQIYAKYPNARKNFLTSLSNQEQLDLWVKGADWKHEM